MMLNHMKPYRNKWDQTDILLGLIWDFEILENPVKKILWVGERKVKGRGTPLVLSSRPRGSDDLERKDDRCGPAKRVRMVGIGAEGLADFRRGGYNLVNPYKLQ